MPNTYYSVDQLPCNMNAEQTAAFLGVSRSKAYMLMHSEGFPTIRIDKRLMVSRDKLLKWIEDHTAE